MRRRAAPLPRRRTLVALVRAATLVGAAFSLTVACSSSLPGLSQSNGSGAPEVTGSGAVVTVDASMSDAETDDGSTDSSAAFDARVPDSAAVAVDAASLFCTSPIIPAARAAVHEICVADATGRIAVFDSTQNGNAFPLRVFGSFFGATALSAVAVDAVHQEIAVLDGEMGRVSFLPLNAGGNAAPCRTLTSASFVGARSLAVDAVHDELIVLDQAGAVDIFDRSGAGAVAALRSYASAQGDAGSATNARTALAFDAQDDEIVVASRGAGTSDAGDAGVASSVVVDRLDRATGSTVLELTFADDASGTRAVTGVAVDPLASEIFVVHGSTVTVLARSGAPLRELTDTAMLASPASPLGVGIAVRPEGEIYLVAPDDSVHVFPHATSGSAMPMVTVADSEARALGYDAVNSRLVVGDQAGLRVFTAAALQNPVGVPMPVQTAGNSVAGIVALSADIKNGFLYIAQVRGDAPVDVFSLSSNDQTGSAKTISAAGLTHPTQIALDTANDEFFVANGNTVDAFSLEAAFTAAPLRSFSASGSGAMASSATPVIAVDDAHDEIVSAFANELRYFARTADGAGATPLRTLSDANIGAVPSAVVDDAAHDEVFVLSGGVVSTYARSASGASAPLRQITSSAIAPTASAVAKGLYLDSILDELFVLTVDAGQASINVFPRIASGAAVPMRTLVGARLGLQNASAIAFCK